MRHLPSLACVSLIALLSACTSSDGYYDDNNEYHFYNDSNKHHQSYPDTSNKKAIGSDYNFYTPAYENNNYRYDRRGYYDYNGRYSDDNELGVPPNMFPPRGKCRVWIVERAPADQPRVESCIGIQSRVPAGAYVIYGG